MEESFYREEELGRENRTLPAATYNLAHTLLRQSGHDCLFVPIRSMQYLAVLDQEEFIFVDREGRRMIELAWQRFKPQGRQSLDDPVPYQVVYYMEKATETMKRLPREFHDALTQLSQKRSFDTTAKVLTLERKKSTD
jgi:hypothetical protein